MRSAASSSCSRASRMATPVGTAPLPPLDGVGAAIDAMGGSFTTPYVTVVVTAARIGS
jgi:hypothetical protein